MPGPPKCRPRSVSSDLTAAADAISDALRVVEARLRSAAAAPDRLAEHDRTLSTLTDLLVGSGHRGRKALLYLAEELDARLARLEARCAECRHHQEDHDG